MKKNFERFVKIIAILVLGVFAISCGKGGKGSAEPGSIEAIKKVGKIRIGVFGDKPPFGFVDENGKNQGYDIYLAKRLAKDLLGDENKIEFITLEAANRVEYLLSNKVDIILANFTVTDERKQKVDFAKPYMKVSLGIVSPEGAPIKDVKELKGKKLIVNKGTTAEIYFTKNYPDIELLKYDQNTETFNALLDKRGAALAHDNTLVFAWATENPGFVVDIKQLGEQDYIAPAVRKGNKGLLDWLNTEIDALTKEGFFEKAYKATLEPVYGNKVDPKTVIIENK